MIKNIMKNIGIKEVAKDNEKLLDRRDELIAKGKLSPEESKEMKDITEKIQHNTFLMLNGNKEAPKDASGADVLNNEYYKDDVRTEEGEKKILSETKTEVIENKIKDLEALKQKNDGKLGVLGEKSLQLAKAELASRKK